MIYGIISLFLCVGLPVISGLLFLKIRKGTFYTFCMGILCFILTQLLLRIPILSFLRSYWDTFALLPATNPALYAGIMAFSAGIFEELGRWLFLRYLCKGKQTWIHGVSFGLGHGGIEAVWIASLGLLPGLYQGALALAGPEVLAVGMERLFTMCIHTALTVLVLQSLQKGQFRYCLAAVVLHGIFDLSVFLKNPVLIWIILGITAVLSLFYLYWTKQQKAVIQKQKEMRDEL